MVRAPRAAPFADREVWYEANARTGRELIALGAALVIVAVAVPLLGPAVPPETQALIYVAVAVIGSLVITVRGARYAARLIAGRRR